ncbi:PKD domain-containing protein [Halosegnis marinus]|uniref:PKD domain-containing protein n=1 Tax=Halosegnis marinus TaxID=3034023 RepID=A0ABD5ZLN2_9EURY|nr:PKD domain-containing protein [Halosegnis sp. DT85]
MAGVSDRGQQLLIGGLVIAVSLTALVVVLNGVLFTEDLRTRDAAADVDAAADYEGAMTRELGRALVRGNGERHPNRSAATDAVLDRAFAVNRLVAAQYAARSGAYASMDPVRVEDGVVVRQTEPCAFLARNTDCGNTTGNRGPYATFSYYDDTDATGDPVAVADQSAPHYPAVGETLYLNASNATDADGAVASYRWVVREGDTVLTETTTNETVAFANVPESGHWNVTLVVTDDDGATSTATRFVPVYEGGDSTELPPNATFGFAPAVAVQGDEITLDASGSRDANGDIAGYEWTVTYPNGSTETLTGETVTETVPTTVAAGADLRVALTVTDDAGNADTLARTVAVRETLADGGGRTGGAPPFRVSGVPGTGARFAVPETGAAPDAANWTLVETDTVRRFRLGAVRASLADVPNRRSDDADALDDTFHVRFEGRDGATWDVHVFESATSGEATVATRRNGSNVTVRSRTDADGVSVDLTRGTVDGEQAFPFAPGLERPYTVSYRNGDEIAGTYSFALGTGSASHTRLRHENFHAPASGRYPYAGPGVYAIQAPLTYDTEGTSRRGVARIAPGEPTRYGVGRSLTVTGPSRVGHDRIVFRDGNAGGRLTTLSRNRTVRRYAAVNPQVIGPMEVDFDADGLAEIPYVNASNTLLLIDANNETQVLADDAAKSKSLLSVGEWNGELVVFYATTDNRVATVTAFRDPERVPTVGLNNGVSGVAGVADQNADGEPDLTSIDGSQQLRYYQSGSGQNVKVSNGGIGQNNGIGVGAPRDFDRDGDRSRLPMIDSSGNLRLIHETTGRTDQLVQGVAVGPVAGFEWDDDYDGLEILFVDDGVLQYVPYTGEATAAPRVVTVNGTTFAPNAAQGVA